MHFYGKLNIYASTSSRSHLYILSFFPVHFIRSHTHLVQYFFLHLSFCSRSFISILSSFIFNLVSLSHLYSPPLPLFPSHHHLSSTFLSSFHSFILYFILRLISNHTRFPFLAHYILNFLFYSFPFLQFVSFLNPFSLFLHYLPFPPFLFSFDGYFPIFLNFHFYHCLPSPSFFSQPPHTV